MLVAVVMLTVLPQVNTLTANAEEPTTYSVKYVSAEQGWRYQYNTSEYDDGKHGDLIVTLRQNLKDGDLVVIYNDLGTSDTLDLGSVRLSNLTYANTQWSIVRVGSVQDCYVLRGSAGTINCDVTNAYVYDPVVFNFNGNVEELIVDSKDAVQSNVGCEGTVGHLRVHSSSPFEFYDFAAGALLFDGGVFKPQGSFATPEEHAANIATLSANKNTATSSDEYDDVPKTGQSNLYLWLLFASVICFAGSRALKRSAE